MTGKLDEISRAIGAIETSVKAQGERAADDRGLADRRHTENQNAIGALRQDTQRAISELSQTATDRWNTTTDTLKELKGDLHAHAVVVSSMQPQRRKLLLLASIGAIAILVLIETAKTGLVAAFTWGLNKFH